MQAVRFHGVRDVRVEPLPEPEPAADEALVAVLWVGLCGSDLEEYVAGPIVTAPPVTLGHEIVGRVERSAADGSGPGEGALVVVDVVTGCGHCFWCLRHEEGQCPDLRVTGFDVDGGLAERVTGRAARLIELPPGLDPRSAVFAEPTAVAVRAARKAEPVAGRGVAIVGGGTVGLLVAQVLRHAGAAPVVVVEPNAARRAVAASLGFATVWGPTPESRSRDLAGCFAAHGVDVVVECSGAAGAPGEAIALARPGGTIVLLGVTPSTQTIDTTNVVLSEKRIVGSAAHMWDDDVAPAVALLASGAVVVEPLISRTFALADVVQAFEELAEPGNDALKILIDIERDAST